MYIFNISNNKPAYHSTRPILVIEHGYHVHKFFHAKRTEVFPTHEFELYACALAFGALYEGEQKSLVTEYKFTAHKNTILLF